MKRRTLLKWMAGAPLLTLLANVPELARAKAAAVARTLRRVRPGQAGWPSVAQWDALNLGECLDLAAERVRGGGNYRSRRCRCRQFRA